MGRTWACGVGIAALLANAIPAFAQPGRGGPSSRPPEPAQLMTTSVTNAQAEMPPMEVVTTLRDAIRQAYWYNPQLLAQRATARANDNRLPGARAGYALNLSGEVTQGYAKDRVENALFGTQTQQGWSTTARLILTQPLYTSGRVANAEKLAMAQIGFARESLRLTETQTLLNTALTYIAVLRDRQSIAIARENLALLEREYSDSRERFQVREITVSDLQQIETRVELGRAQLILAEAQIGQSEAQFVQVVGARPGDLAPPTELVLPVSAIEQAYDQADDNNPTIRAAHAREKITRAAAETVKAEFGPRIDGRGTASWGTVTPYSNDLRANLLRGEVVLTMPLLDGNLRLSQLRQQQEANAADWRLIDQAVREAHSAVATNWQQLTATRMAINNYAKAVDAARKAYDGAVVQEKFGARTTLDVLDLARDLLNLRNGYNSTIANEYIARANLLSATGSLDIGVLVPDMERYDADEYFQKIKGRADIPLWTDLLSGVDGLSTPNVRRDRPSTDPAKDIHMDARLPLAPTPVPAPVVGPDAIIHGGTDGSSDPATVTAP